MRSTLAVLAVTALALGACHKKDAAQASGADAGAVTTASADAGTPLTPDNMPHRKPGLWKTDLTIDGRHANSETQCVGPDTDKTDSTWLARTEGQKTCKPSVTRQLDGSIHINLTCDMGQLGKVTSIGVVQGDFNDHYPVHMDTTMSGSPLAQANAHHMSDMDSRWVGPCSPGQAGR